MLNRSSIIALMVLAVLGVACGATDEQTGAGPSSSVTVAAPADDAGASSSTLATSAPDASATTPSTSSDRPAPDPSRQLAPDFSLELANGSTFVLSEETRPVYMVFWAEW